MTANEVRKITDKVIQKKKEQEIASATELLNDVIYPGIKDAALKGMETFSIRKSSAYSSGVYASLAKMLNTDGYRVDNSLANIMSIRW